MPLNELDEDKACQEVEFRINSSSTIIEVSAVLGGFAFDQFLSTNDYMDAWSQKYPILFNIFSMATFLAFCANMITVAVMSMELYVVNRLLR